MPLKKYLEMLKDFAMIIVQIAKGEIGLLPQLAIPGAFIAQWFIVLHAFALATSGSILVTFWLTVSQFISAILTIALVTQLIFRVPLSRVLLLALVRLGVESRRADSITRDTVGSMIILPFIIGIDGVAGFWSHTALLPVLTAMALTWLSTVIFNFIVVDAFFDKLYKH